MPSIDICSDTSVFFFSAGLFSGQDSEAAVAAYKKTGAPAAGTLQVPEPDAEAAEEVEGEKE